LYRTITELKRVYEVRGKVSISDSSWHDRFTPELVKFLRENSEKPHLIDNYKYYY